MKRITNKLVTKLIMVVLSFTLVFTASILVQPSKAEAAMSASTLANYLISTGNRFLGVPYQWGAPFGNTATFDCSSFTKYVFSKNGMYLPRTSGQQAKLGFQVSRANLRKGDLVFFWTPSSNGKPQHVGIYAGNGYILHTYGAGGVKYSNLNSSYWSRHFIAGRRILKW